MTLQLDLSRADLNLLVVFEAVLTERHVGRAGQRLNLSPSAVSHSLSRLRRMFADPLFLRTPKGVVPTVRAEELAPAIGEILEGVRRVISSSAPFDPATSARRFSVGVPDGEATLVVSQLLNAVATPDSNLDLSVRAVMPMDVLAALESGVIDVAVTPKIGDVPKRFHAETLYVERFVIAMRRGHPYAGAPGLDAYCGFPHAVMSITGDTHGFVDETLSALGRSRRVALALPSFLSILAALDGTDLLAAVPQTMVERYAERFGLHWIDPPLDLGASDICAMATRAARADDGVAWLLDRLRQIHHLGRTASDAHP